MISVVIPIYNKADTVKKAIDSVLNQTFTDFEIIAVDDGSTDQSSEIIKQCFSDSRIYIYKQENLGVSTARNKGVALSNFEYIAFLDADDYWDKEYLFHMVNAIKKCPDAGMVCSGGFVVNPRKHLTYRLPNKYRQYIGYIKFFENPHVFVHTSATVVSKYFFNKAGGFPEGMKRNQDFALFFSIALISKVAYIGFPLSYYVGGISGQATSAPINQVLQHVVNRFNYVYKKSKQENVTISTKRLFKVFNKYELRHILLGRLKDNDYKSIKYILENLDKESLKELMPFEKKFYINSSIRFLAFSWIYFTKVLWRFKGFPVVGK